MSNDFLKECELSALSDPINLQVNILNEIERKLSHDDIQFELVGPNNGFSLLLESSTSIGAAIAAKTDNILMTMYPQRAITSRDLYKHMSDYDYDNIFNTPATVDMTFTFDKRFLLNNAERVNEHYRRATIPRDTKVSINGRTFSLYYPIDIDITDASETCLVTYNTDELNRLHDLKTNLISHVKHTVNGIEYWAFTVPMYQFVKTRYVETITKTSSFSKEYNAKGFYTCRVYTKSKDDVLTELHTTHSEDIYDPYVSTAKLMLMSETDTLKVSIPQVYMSKDMIKDMKLVVDVYTSDGELDVDITNVNMKNVELNFGNVENEKYSKIFKSNSPRCMVIPQSTRIVGGSDGLTFNELRQRVINKSFGTTPITPTELANYCADKGFTHSLYKDNITDRYYYAHKVVYDDGRVIALASIPFTLDVSKINEYTAIHQYRDGSITVTPDALFEYHNDTQSCIPLSSSEREDLFNLDKKEKVNAFNTTQYVYSPYYVRLCVEHQYAHAYSYDLSIPKMESLVFKEENTFTVEQFTCHHVDVEKTSTGYRFNIYTTRSKNIEQFDQSEFVLYANIKTEDGSYVGRQATYVDRLDVYDRYVLDFETDYAFSESHSLSFINLSDSNGLQLNQSYCSLDSVVNVFCMMNRHIASDTKYPSTLGKDLPQSLLNDYVPLIKQELHTHFGMYLSRALNIVDFHLSGEKKATYRENIIKKYEEDVYKRNPDGSLKYSLNESGDLELEVEHHAGDAYIDDDGHPFIVHRKGDVILDSYGKPIIEKERNIEYYVDALFLDAKYLISENDRDVEFTQKGFYNTMESYYSAVEELSSVLIENTKFFFKPIRTIGNAQYEQGNRYKVTLPLQLEFSFRYHVYDFVFNDASLIESIRSQTISLIEEEISDHDVSMAEIAAIIKERLKDYIAHIDVLGINTYNDMQTISLLDKSVKPSIKEKLSIDNLSRIDLLKDINISFVVVA